MLSIDKIKKILSLGENKRVEFKKCTDQVSASVYETICSFLNAEGGHIFLGVYGICAGFFVGCVAVALAEILKTFPVIFRRLKVKTGLQVILLFMAFGKMAGALFYFIRQLSDS